MGFFDIFNKSSKNEQNHERMRKIRESGRSGEEQFRYENALSDIKKRHHGRDFDKPVTDSRGRKRIERWEVKRNNSPLSKKQKKTWGLKVRRYVDNEYGFPEARTENRNRDRLEQNIFTGKWEKVKKRDNFGNLFGYGSSEPKRRKNDNYSFGSGLDNMLGVGSSNKRSRRNNDYGFGSGLDNMFGSGNSGRRKRNSSDSWGLGF